VANSFFTELKKRNVFKVGIAYLVLAWVVVQVTQAAVPALNMPDWVNTVIFFFGIVGFPFALFFAWAFEVTPEGIKKESEITPDESITAHTGEKLNYIIIGLLVVALGYFVYESRFSSGSDKEVTSTTAEVDLTAEKIDTVELDKQVISKQIIDKSSIAVLPFSNRSNNKDDLYFTDGIHDDILTQLAKIKEMKVTSRTSVMKYRSTEKSIGVIAKELEVGIILEGGVQRAGKRIRINAQLIDAATDEHLWAETFDREMSIDNLFDIQSEITKHIVKAIKGKLDPEEIIMLENKQTQSLEAWEAYSKARQIINGSGHNAEKYLSALPLVKRATELDPLFLSAQLMMVEVSSMLFWTDVDLTESNKQRALTALNNAIEIAPTSAEVLMAQGNYAYRLNRDFRLALSYQQRALEDNPTNTDFLAKIGLTQRRLGLWEEAIENLLFATKLSQDNLSIITSTATTLDIKRDTKRLALFLEKVRERFPNAPDLESIAANLVLKSEGDLKKAQTIHQGIIPNSGSQYIIGTLNFAWLQRDQSAIIDALNRPEVITFLKRYPMSLEGERGLAYHIYGKNKLADIEFNKVISLQHNTQLTGTNLSRAFQLTNLAIAKILLGETEAGITLARQALTIYSHAIDKVDGARIDRFVSYALALAGERDEALKMIEWLLDTPDGYWRWHLYLDPRWDFFRDDERFNQLIKPLNFEQSVYFKNQSSKETE
jgi:TolB-like protein/Tfp pilus assembly protein PilF